MLFIDFFFKKQCWLRICFFWQQIIKRKKKKWEYAAPTMDDVEHSSKRTTQACQGA